LRDPSRIYSGSKIYRQFEEPWNLTFRSYLLTNTHSSIGEQIKFDDVRKFFEKCDSKSESTVLQEILDNKL